MTIADFGYDAHQGEPVGRSLDVTRGRGGYTVHPSLAAFNLRSRMIRAGLSAATISVGAVLALGGKSLVAVSGLGASLMVPLGVYLVIAGLFWLSVLLRRPQELIVDKSNRVFHIVKPTLAGAQRSRETIRFEEVAKIAMVDRVKTFDMSADAKGWEMARLDVIWQGDRVSSMITGDINEVEPLLIQLRREVGMS